MSLAVYYDQLAEIALGWLGWTEQQALDSDVNAIQIAYRGRVEMLRACFGGGSGSSAGSGRPTPSRQPLTPKLFDAMCSTSRRGARK